MSLCDHFRVCDLKNEGVGIDFAVVLGEIWVTGENSSLSLSGCISEQSCFGTTHHAFFISYLDVAGSNDLILGEFLRVGLDVNRLIGLGWGRRRLRKRIRNEKDSLKKANASHRHKYGRLSKQCGFAHLVLFPSYWLPPIQA